jgi:UDP-glucose 4-epimerase
VTGGCGFIGSHLVDRLLAEGHEVRIIDNLSTGRLQNLEHHKAHNHLQIHIADITDHAQILPFFEGVDTVYHLAALADIVPSIENPFNYHRSNVDGTISVLEAARAADVKRFVYAASSSCYGIPNTFPTSEDAEIRPQYPYALTKYVGECYVMHWHQVYKLPVTSVRFFNVYGPRSRTSGTYGAVFGVFLAQKLASKPYTVVGDGSQTRDFTFVTDVADACFLASHHPDAVGEIFNVGSGQTYSINMLVELLEGDVIHIPHRPGEPDCTFANIDKIRHVLGWKAKVDFQTGVGEMLKHIAYWEEAPVWDPKSIETATRDWFKYLG